MSKELKFSTNINCAGCEKRVRPFLDEAQNLVLSWQVDTSNPKKILSVEASDEAQAQDLIDLLEEAGFDAEILDPKDLD